jgi:hypothetical protein
MVVTPNVLTTICLADESDQATPTLAEKIKGKWVLYRETPQGRFMTIKIHNGSESIITTYDPSLKEVYAHRSDYIIDASGPANVFTYHNKKVLVGKGAGTVVPEHVSYLFRLDGERFLEVHGMMKNDTRKPSMTVWERLKEDPIKRPAT